MVLVSATESRVELVCSNCGKAGGLGEEVTVESSGWRPAKCYAAPGGKVEVKYGFVENTGFEDVTSVEEIACTHCGETFATWEAATGDQPYEYNCDTCGWWGIQDWLHDPGCPGELRELKLPRLPEAQEAIAV